jgi:hypothetical protein
MALEAHDRAGQGAGDTVNSLDAANDQLPKRVQVEGRNPSHHVIGSGNDDSPDNPWDLSQLLGNLSLLPNRGHDENVGVNQRFS